MELTPQLLAWVEAWGPWLVALLAFLETAFITGLLIPCGPVLIAAVALASEGLLELEWIVLAAVSGALAGDSVGYWVGARGGGHAARTSGRLGRIARRAEPRARRLFGRHPFFAVTVARLVSFVRTLMPPAAGLGDLGYSRFLFWDALGVLLWAALYVGIGLAAEGGLSFLDRVLGTGGAIAAVVLVALTLWTLRRRPGRGPGAEEGMEEGMGVSERPGHLLEPDRR